MPKSKKKQEKKNFAALSANCIDQLEDHYIVIPFTFKIGRSPDDQMVTGYVLI